MRSSKNVGDQGAYIAPDKFIVLDFSVKVKTPSAKTQQKQIRKNIGD